LRHRGSTGLARIVALATICMAGPVQGRSWGTPGRDYGRYGILTMVCDERRHAAPCLGLACFDRTLALVSAAGGGGPMEGATRVSNGRTAFTLRFEFDPAAIDRLGVAASRASLDAAQFQALLGAEAITLAANTDPSVRHRFSARGLAREWRRAAASCRS
jgi:hypothetical protein